MDKDNQTYYEQGNCVITRNTARLKFTGVNFEIPRGVKIISSCSVTLRSSNTLVIPEGVEEVASSAINLTIEKAIFVLPSSLKIFFDGIFCSWSSENIEKIVVPKGQKNRFARMWTFENLKDFIVEAGD